LGISADADFQLYYLEDNALSNLPELTIYIGRKVLSLEVLIHEINEMEIEEIINRWGFEVVPIRYIVKRGKVIFLPKDGYNVGQRWNGIVHFVCPFGVDSLFFPANKLKPKPKSLLRSKR